MARHCRLLPPSLAIFLKILSDAQAASYVDGIAVHFYFDYEHNTWRLDETHNAHPDRFIMYTEVRRFERGFSFRHALAIAAMRTRLALGWGIGAVALSICMILCK